MESFVKFVPSFTEFCAEQKSQAGVIVEKMLQSSNFKNANGCFESKKDSKINKNVRHSEKTGDKNHGKDGWIGYWEKKTGKSRYDRENCPCCTKKVTEENYWVGAHVETKDGQKFITPTCKECNDTYKEGKADEKWFIVSQDYLCQLPPQTQEQKNALKPTLG